MLILFALIGFGAQVSAEDVQIEANCVVVELISDNNTFVLSEGPVVNKFTANVVSEVIPATYTWQVYNETTKTYVYKDVVYNHPNNEFFATFTTPGQYNVSVVAENNTLNPPRCFYPVQKIYNAVLPINGNFGWRYTGAPYEMIFDYFYPLFATHSAIPNQFEWNFDDNTVNNTTYGLSINHTFPTKNFVTYDVMVTASNNSSMNAFYPSNTSVNSVSPLPAPLTDFYIVDNFTKGPVPLEVRLRDNSSWPYEPYFGCPSFNWAFMWDLDDRNTSTNQNLDHTYYEPGTYNISLNSTISHSGCLPDLWNTTTRTIIAYDPIKANYTTDLGSCPTFPLTVKFNDNSTGSKIDRWQWDYGDKTPIESKLVNWTEHTYHKPEQYWVNMTGFNDTYDIFEYKNMSIDITGLFANFTINPQDSVIWKGEPLTVLFNSTSVGVDLMTKYNWVVEKDGQSFTDINPNTTMVYDRNGTYNVSLTVTNNSGECLGKANTSRQQVRIFEYLQPDFTYLQDIGTYPYHVRFFDSSTDHPDQWNWEFFDKSGNKIGTKTDQNTDFDYTETGKYKVKLTVRSGDFGQLIPVEKEITVYENIRADFTPNVTKGVSPLPVKFTDNSIPSESISNWTWNFDDGTTNQTKSPEHIFRLPDGIAQKQFNVNLTVRNQTTGASNSTIKIIDVIAPLKADFIPKGKVPTNLTEGVQFTNQSTGNITGFLWDFDDESTPSTEKNPLHKFPDYGLYNVTLTVSNDYYQTSNSTRNLLNITDKSSPKVIDFSADATIVNRKDPVVFTAQVQGPDIQSYYWDFGDGKNSTGTQPSHAYELPGKFDVSLTVTSPFGTDTLTKSQYIWVRGLIPSFITIPSGWAMVNTPVTFMDTSLGGTEQWRWDFGDGTIEDSPTYMTTHTYTETDTYPISLTVKNWEGLQETIRQEITIVNKTVPQGVDFEVPELQYSGKAPFDVQFEDKTPAQSNVIERFWEFGDGTNSFEQAPTHRYEKPGQYTVTLTVRNENGTNEKRRVAYVVVL